MENALASRLGRCVRAYATPAPSASGHVGRVGVPMVRISYLPGSRASSERRLRSTPMCSCNLCTARSSVSLKVSDPLSNCDSFILNEAAPGTIGLAESRGGGLRNFGWSSGGDQAVEDAQDELASLRALCGRAGIIAVHNTRPRTAPRRSFTAVSSRSRRYGTRGFSVSKQKSFICALRPPPNGQSRIVSVGACAKKPSKLCACGADLETRPAEAPVPGRESSPPSLSAPCSARPRERPARVAVPRLLAHFSVCFNTHRRPCNRHRPRAGTQPRPRAACRAPRIV